MTTKPSEPSAEPVWDRDPSQPPVRAYIAVGSNIRPMHNIPAAWTALQRLPGVRPIGSSRFWRTRPLGRTDQPDFVNGAWAILTEHDPAALKAHLRAIEDQLERQRSADKNAPRTIDLDLILYGTRVDPDLRLPHPDLARPFVHAPILELLADDPHADVIRQLIHDHLGHRATPTTTSTPASPTTSTPTSPPAPTISPSASPAAPASGPAPAPDPPGIYLPELTAQLRAAIP